MPTIPMNVYYSGVKTRIPESMGGSGNSGTGSSGSGSITTSNIYGVFSSNGITTIPDTVSTWTTVPIKDIKDITNNALFGLTSEGHVVCKHTGYVIASATVQFYNVNPGTGIGIQLVNSTSSQTLGVTNGIITLDGNSSFLSCSGVFKVTAGDTLSVEAKKVEGSSADVLVNTLVIAYFTSGSGSSSSGGDNPPISDDIVEQVIARLKEMSASSTYDFVQTYNDART